MKDESRRRNAKGANHEETLAHLAALAVHLEATGRREEAADLSADLSAEALAKAEARRAKAEYKREHDRLQKGMKDEG